jgi:hypothetical protein
VTTLEDEGVEAIAVVLDGRRRFFDSPSWGARIEDQRPEDLNQALGTARHLLAPASLLSALEIQRYERGIHDGRAVWQVTARDTNIEIHAPGADGQRLVELAESLRPLA